MREGDGVDAQNVTGWGARGMLLAKPGRDGIPPAPPVGVCLTPGFRPSPPVPSCGCRPVRAGCARRRWRAVRCALAAALALVLIAAAPAGAQTSVTLVSNDGQSPGAQSLGSGDISTAFTTGSSAEGYNYKLTSVDLYFVAGVTVTGINTDIYDTNSDGSPNNWVGDLIAPGTLKGGKNTFATRGTGIDLAPNTTYAVFMDTGTVTTGFTTTTASDDEDSGAAPGWSIAGGLTRGC